MRTSSRNLAVLLFDEVELLDVAGFLQVVTSAGRQWNFRPFRVLTVAERPGLIETRSQVRLEARYGLSDCPPPEVLFIPGGYGARRAAGSSAIVEWAATHGPRAEYLVALGAGVLLLAKAGLVDGVSVTVPADVLDALTEAAPSVQARTDLAGVEDAGKVLTASTSAGGLDMGLRVVSKVLGTKQAAAVARQLGYGWSELEQLKVEILDPVR